MCTTVNAALLADAGAHFDGVVDLTGLSIVIPDGTHPNNAGMQTIADAATTVFNSLL